MNFNLWWHKHVAFLILPVMLQLTCDQISLPRQCVVSTGRFGLSLLSSVIIHLIKK